MPLIKDGRFITDAWRHLGDADTTPEGDAVTVSLTRWTSERDALFAARAAWDCVFPTTRRRWRSHAISSASISSR